MWKSFAYQHSGALKQKYASENPFSKMGWQASIWSLKVFLQSKNLIEERLSYG